MATDISVCVCVHNDYMQIGMDEHYRFTTYIIAYVIDGVCVCVQHIVISQRTNARLCCDVTRNNYTLDDT